MKATFDNTVSILVKAYLNDTLVHGNCYACAVGNIVAEGLGTCVVLTENMFHRNMRWANGERYPGENGSNDPGWGKLFSTDRSGPFRNGKKKQNINKRLINHPNIKRQIESTGYHWTELARIEQAFESVDKRRKDKMFLGLMAVVDVLAEIHNIDLEQKESAKLLFVKQP